LLRALTSSCWLERGAPHTEPVINYSSRVIKSIAPADTLETACRKLTGSKLHYLPVVENNKFVGLIGELDIRKAIGHSDVGQWLAWPVSQVMQTGLDALTSKSTLLQAAEKMQQYHVTALPIVDRHGLLLSLVTGPDVLQAFSSCDATVHI